ncbi:MAG: hypothetical protein LBL94_12160, partial [Prevotellaceae bacterium]|nr:hypothetical protein [Prevotellaceae bacterium]
KQPNNQANKQPKRNKIMIATQQRKAKPYRTGYVPHTVPHVEEHDDTLMSKEEFFAKIDAAFQPHFHLIFFNKTTSVAKQCNDVH